jgi:hypothetical protein
MLLWFTLLTLHITVFDMTLGPASLGPSPRPCLQPEAPQQCAPAAARKAVKAHPDRVPQLSRQQQLVPLLAYSLRGLDLSTGPTGSWLQQLMGLRLLPLADGDGLAYFEAAVGQAGPKQLVFVVTDDLEQALVQNERELGVHASGWVRCDSACDSTLYPVC